MVDFEFGVGNVLKGKFVFKGNWVILEIIGVYF